jgi:hypothetical protein
MTLVQHLSEWWENRSEDQRQALTAAAQEDRMDGDTVRLLLGTRCPVGPIGTKWESQPEYGWSWPQSVQSFIAAQ